MLQSHGSSEAPHTPGRRTRRNIETASKWSLGVLNSHDANFAPGTVQLFARSPVHGDYTGGRSRSPSNDVAIDSSSRSSSPEIKKTAGDIVLTPQPDDSPNDPLNWPQWRRDCALASLGLYCMLGGGMTPILAAGFNDVAQDYSIAEPKVALSTGLYMLGLGLGSVIWAPTAILFGKRPVYLSTAVLFIVTSVWCALSPSYGSLLAARIVQGLAVAPVECLPSASISEIYFLHERAFRLGVYTLLLLGGKNLIPLVSAAVIGSLGWRWVFWIVSMIAGFCQILLIFLVPESYWDRSLSTGDPVCKEASSRNVDNPSCSIAYTALQKQLPKHSFAQGLKPYHGRLEHGNWALIALRPFVLFAYPAILWSAATYALSVGWLIVLSESMTQVFHSSSTYGFTSLQIGLLYISPFVGGILGTVVAGKFSDLMVRYMARRNNGVYEPEFRLVMALPTAFATAIGLMGFGWSAQSRDAWIVPTIFFGIMSFGCTLGSTTAIAFAVDSYSGYASEALVTLNFFKNVFHGLVFSLFFTSWLKDAGSKIPFAVVGGVHFAFMLSTILVYIFGKRLRVWTAKARLMRRF